MMVLEPGDLVLTGTPPGVGLATGSFLEKGDVVELAIEGLGSQRAVCRPADGGVGEPQEGTHAQ